MNIYISFFIKYKKKSFFVCFSFPLPLSPHVLRLEIYIYFLNEKTLHFEYISEVTASGLMSVGIQTSTPVVYGVLNCLNEEQVKARSSGDNNHGYDWGKTAVEMALLRNQAMDIKSAKEAQLGAMGFGKATPLEVKEKSKPGFF